MGQEMSFSDFGTPSFDDLLLLCEVGQALGCNPPGVGLQPASTSVGPVSLQIKEQVKGILGDDCKE